MPVYWIPTHKVSSILMGSTGLLFTSLAESQQTRQRELKQNMLRKQEKEKKERDETKEEAWLSWLP